MMYINIIAGFIILYIIGDMIWESWKHAPIYENDDFDENWPKSKNWENVRHEREMWKKDKERLTNGTWKPQIPLQEN